MKKYLGVLCAVLLTVACLVVPASAANAPDFDVESAVSSYTSETGWDYVMAHGYGQYRIWIWPKDCGSVKLGNSRTNLSVSCTVDNSDSSKIWLCYSSEDGISWIKILSSPFSKGAGSAFFIGADSSLYICESTIDIYDANGELFFQKPSPPWTVETLAGTVEVAPALVKGKLTTTLDCLVPLGIGLMALFVGLLLLRIVFYRFRVKS